MEINNLIETGFRITCTKFLNVKTPIGINQREKKQEFPDIGIDLYMPRFNNSFIEAVLKSNKTLEYKPYRNMHNFVSNKVFKDNIVMSVFEKTFNIYSEIQIPLGIGFKIPNGYHLDLRSKSSNFHLGFTPELGLIDSAYTYGFGLQIKPNNNNTDNDLIKLSEDQKVCQIVLIKSNPILEINCISEKEWNVDIEIQKRRGDRSGGFGSTGKYDK